MCVVEVEAHGVQPLPRLKVIRLQMRDISRQVLCDAFAFLYNLYAMRICMTPIRCDHRVEVLQARRCRPGYWDDRVKQDWFDRIHAGAGCWSAEELGEEGAS